MFWAAVHAAASIEINFSGNPWFPWRPTRRRTQAMIEAVSTGMCVERGETLERLTPCGERHRMRYQGHDRFVSNGDSEVSFEFTVEHGRAVAFVLTQRGLQTTARRLE